MGPLGSARYRDYADDINASGSHLLTLVNDILDVAKLGTSHIELVDETVDCAVVTADCLRLVKQQARNSGVELQCALAPDLPPLRADALRFRQILLNLLSNAVKFTPAEGRVTIAAGSSRPAPLFCASPTPASASLRTRSQRSCCRSIRLAIPRRAAAAPAWDCRWRRR